MRQTLQCAWAATDDDAASCSRPSVCCSSPALHDLQVEVQTILDSNLMLERADDLQDMPVQPEDATGL